ncbi:hypothetical protein L596_027916 [Steinernema carpocapsae]|uniref:Uncharacterized protein n=1 Tax=Steinernema carpocapsae TaxID=34508 RepID=A0A4U5LX10_STECR|nr:hypothetical protein L596_027916 [Steinernema carpocapsae]
MTHEESQKGDEKALDSAMNLISDVGKSWDQQRILEISQKRLRHGAKPQVKIDFNLPGYIAHLHKIASTLSNRMNFKILDLIDLWKNKWEPRKSQAQKVPKTLEEIHAALKKEAFEKETAEEGPEEWTSEPLLRQKMLND